MRLAEACRRRNWQDYRHTGRYVSWFWFMRLPFLAVLCLMALPCGIASASASVMSPAYPPALQHFTDNDGLPLNNLTHVIQTRDGYLWIASVGGLTRFDGTTFTSIPLSIHHPALDGPATEVSGLPSIRILELLEDNLGRIWIATQDSGVSLYDHGRIFQLDACSGICQINQFVLHGGYVYAASDSGLLRIDLATLKSESLLDGEDANVGSLAFDRQGQIFMVVNGALATLEEREPWLHEMPQGIVMPRRLFPDDDGIFMAAFSGLYHFASATGMWTRHDLGPIEDVIRTADGTLMASSPQGKIYRRAPNGDWKVLADIAPMSPSRLAKDNEGNLWIGTLSSGLIRLRRTWIGTLADPDFDMRHPGRAVAPDGQGGIWFAMACAHLRHWRADGTVENQLTLDIAHALCVETLHRGHDGTLWMGDAQGRLQRLRGEDEVETLLQWPGHQTVRAIHQVPDGPLLVSVRRSTLEIFLAADGSLAQEPRPIPALEGLIVRQIVPSRRQGMWFVGEFGAMRLHEGRVVERWGPEQGLSSKFARVLHEEIDGTLWIGTYGAGLNRIADGKLTIYHQGNGLYDDTVSCILEDEEGRLWLSGNRGIAVLDPASATETSIQSRGFAGNDGLNPAEANGGHQSNCMVDDAGRFLFAMVEGFAVLDPNRYHAPVTPPPAVHIEHVSVGGNVRDPGEPLRLGASSQNIEIGYTAVALTAPSRLRFRFRLKGVDPDWIDTGATRHVFYPSLPWGNYMFQVQARLDGAPWRDTWAELHIQHPAPWYQRPWVWLACTLLALLLLLDATWQRPSSETADEQPAA